jgi:hypothetical protein
MSDVFDRTLRHTGSVRPEDIFMSSLDGLGSGLVTGISLDYTQQVSRVWSLLAGDMWLVAGETSGTCSVESLMGGGGTHSGTVCEPGSASIVCGPGPCLGPNNPGKAYTMQKTYVQGISLKGQSSSGLNINEGITIGFVTLS